MKNGLAALIALLVGLQASSFARADLNPDQTHTALAAIEEAKSLVAAGRGQLLLVGSALSTDQAPSENVLAILEHPIVREMSPGTILMLAKTGCEPREACLIARRVSQIDAKGQVQTEPFTTAGLLFGNTEATLLGIVSFAIDLETGSIRDMHVGRAQASVTLSQAIVEEAAQTRARF